MDTGNEALNPPLNPEHARKIAVILSIQPDDSQPMTQFSPAQRQAYEWAVRWIHDYNLGRMPKPGFSDEVLGRLGGFHEAKMNAHFRQQPAAAPKPAGVPAAPPPSSEAGDFVRVMLHNLNTHEPYEPRGMNTRNCQQTEYRETEPLPMPPVDDPLAEWTQRMLAGMKRMTEDPEYRASIERRLF